MKPKQIIVFDGLRVTTEHLDHLQGAFLTGLQDLRKATGLGKVISGLEVLVKGDNQVEVQPGLAFDRAGNRMVLDEPKTLDVAFPEGQDVLWITIRYDQRESGEIEGKNTLVWDDSQPALQADAPGPQDLAIAIARLAREENGTLVVYLPAAEPAESKNGSASSSEGTPAGSAATDVGSRPANGASPQNGTAANSGGAQPGAIALAHLVVNQGIARLRGPADPNASLLKSLAATVRRSPAVEGGTLGPALTLATMDIDVPSTPASLSCQAVLIASIAMPEGETASNGTWSSLCATAWGEVSPTDETMDQYALVTYSAGYQALPSDLIEGLVAQLPLAPWADAVQNWGDTPVAASSPSTPRTNQPELAACRYLQLSVRVLRINPPKLKFVFSLEWKGGNEEDHIRLLESSTYRIQTNAQVGWKALRSAS